MPRADVSLHGDHITVETSYTDKDRMTLIPGSGYQGASAWHVPLSWASCVILRGVFGSELELLPGLREWARREKRRVDRALQLREALELPADSPGAVIIDQIEAGSELRLRPFQRADVGYLVTMEKDCLFAPMGAGKTAVSIRTLQVLRELGRDPLPALIIAPNSVKASVWPRELARWAPELSVAVVDGGASTRRKQIAQRADVTVINWEAVQLHSRVAGYGDIRLADKDKEEKELNDLAPVTVIMDEAHRLRDPATKQSRAAKWLAHRARFAFALTGTPINDDAIDLWGILHVVAPGWHPGKTKYVDRYVQTGYSLYGGLVVLGLQPDTEPEFRAVTSPLYRRIPKDVILPQLPPKLEPQIRHTPMTPKQVKLYRQMEEDMLAQVDDLLVAQNPMIQVMRLLQFAAATAEHVEITRDEHGQPHYRVTLSEPSSKIDDLLELLAELGDEPLVVAACSRQLIELAAERLRKSGISCGVIKGGLPAADRALAVDRFQRGDDRVILLVLRAGAEGLNLTRSRVILFMQEDWAPDVNAQAEDRVHRIGSEIHSSIQVIKQVTPGTVEERKPLVLASKHGRIEEVLRDRETAVRLLGGK